MTGHTLRTRLSAGPPLLLDGALGTELERRRVAGPLPLWSAAALLDAPGKVLEAHAAEVEAGADVLTANTFRTHRRTLARAGLGERASDLTRRAVALAREAAASAPRPVYVVGSLSPLEDCYRPDLVPDDAALEAEHAEQAARLAAAGVDGILVETHNTVRELAAAARGAKATGLPVIASMITDGAGRLLSGEPIEDAVSALASIRPEVLAINCVPARRLVNDLRALASANSGALLGAYGNLGRPMEDGGYAEAATPEGYARFAGSWLDAGARLIGGCCGTSPRHTAALAGLIASRR
jgi:S-methylmethionine-dependent homocysteine/selenocysteine methylase